MSEIKCEHEELWVDNQAGYDIKCRYCNLSSEEVLAELNARIKDQEATIDALLAQNKTQMLELEKLEAWQKEAVKFLPLAKDDMEEAIRHDPLNRDEYKKEMEQIANLIKQAEDN